MDYVFQFNVVWENIGWLLEGIRVTLIVTFGSLSSGLVFGLLLGMVRLSKRRWLSRLAQAYVELFRNTPALVQLIWVYYCLPILTGINLDAITSCTVALALYGTAYIAEIFRAGIKSIDIGQVEAAQSIGLTYMQAMWSVVLPQAVAADDSAAGQRIDHPLEVFVFGFSARCCRSHVSSTSTLDSIVPADRDLHRDCCYLLRVMRRASCGLHSKSSDAWQCRTATPHRRRAGGAGVSNE